MFVIKHKFNVGDTVRCVSTELACDNLFNRICIIKELYDDTVYNRSEHKEACGYYIYAHDENPIPSKLYIVGEWMLEPATLETNTNRITDPNTDYKNLFKEPYYIEFIDIGEALEKLKIYENKEAGNVYGEFVELTEAPDVPDISDIKVGDVVFFSSKFASVKNVACAKVHEVYPMFIRIIYPSGKTFDLNRKECFKTYEEALAKIK